MEGYKHEFMQKINKQRWLYSKLAKPKTTPANQQGTKAFLSKKGHDKDQEDDLNKKQKQ